LRKVFSFRDQKLYLVSDLEKIVKNINRDLILLRLHPSVRRTKIADRDYMLKLLGGRL